MTGPFDIDSGDFMGDFIGDFIGDFMGAATPTKGDAGDASECPAVIGREAGNLIALENVMTTMALWLSPRVAVKCSPAAILTPTDKACTVAVLNIVQGALAH